jgi:hypothetical protein
MLRPISLVLVSLAIAVSSVPAWSASVPSSGSAPADEYFGRFKYSAISVRTKIDALARAYDSRWEDDASILHDAGLVEDSLRAWVGRYPQDPWAPAAALHLAELYARVQTKTARERAIAAYRYVAQTFPHASQAHLARLRLAQGFPALHAESALRPTPSPYAPRDTPAPASPLPASSVPAAAPMSPASALPASSAPVPTATPR